MTEYHANAEALRKAMRQRRVGELKRSQREAAEKGDLSRIAIVRYESGQISEDIRPSTLAKIDKALDWPEGWSDKILNQTVPQQDPEPEPEHPGVDLQMLAKFCHAVTTMQHAMADEIQNIPEDVRSAMQDVTIAQTDLLLDLTDKLTAGQS